MNTRVETDPNPYYYKGLTDAVGDEGAWALDERWPDVEAVAAFQHDDEVLDVGCAEGLISLKVAQQVRFVLGVELQPQRFEAAETIRRQHGIQNVRFEAGSICDMQLEPLSYDVVLFLGVFHHLPRDSKMPVLNKLLHATRRDIIIRTPLLRAAQASPFTAADGANPHQNRIANITGACEALGFDHRLVANRKSRGGDLVVARRRAA